MKKPKYEIDDIVILKDEHCYNPAAAAIFIGKISSITIIRIPSILFNYKKGIYYSIRGYPIINVKEEDITLYVDYPNNIGAL